MTVFFDPADYLERDPETAGSAAEERRLQRRAELRARLCEAMTQIAAERGFEAATAQQVFLRAELGSGTFYRLYESREACLLEEAARVKDIVERAGLSIPLFYTHFNSKEDCLLAAFDAAVASILELVEAAVANATTTADRAAAGLRALVGSLAERPEVARLALIEIRKTGRNGEERYGEALARFARLIAPKEERRQWKRRIP
jgi:AcrR family transcriptional regulator